MAQDNPFLAGRTTVNNRYLDLSSSVRNWRIAASVFAALAVGSNAANWYVLHRSTVEPVIVQVNEQSQIIQAYQAGSQSPAIDEAKLIGAELARWIKQARELNADWQFQKSQYASLFQKVSGSAEGTLTAYYKVNSPQVMAQSSTVSVSIKSLQRLSDKTWQVRWEETKTEKKSGEAIGAATKWEAFLTVERKTPGSLQQALENPLGLYVTSLKWEQGLE